MVTPYFIRQIGFVDGEATELRPPVGETWRVLFCQEIGATTGNLVITNGTLTENYTNTDSRNQPLLTNDWYFTLVDQGDTDLGYLVSIENVTFVGR